MGRLPAVTAHARAKQSRYRTKEFIISIISLIGGKRICIKK